MTTLTAPRRSSLRRPRTAVVLISATVVALVVLAIALALPRASSAPSVTNPAGSGTVFAPGGGGNEDHPHPRAHPRTVAKGPADRR